MKRVEAFIATFGRALTGTIWKRLPGRPVQLKPLLVFGGVVLLLWHASATALLALMHAMQRSALPHAAFWVWPYGDGWTGKFLGISLIAGIGMSLVLAVGAALLRRFSGWPKLSGGAYARVAVYSLPLSMAMGSIHGFAMLAATYNGT